MNTMDSDYLIQLDCPAASFTEGFPIGTGRIAAMVYSTMPEDKLSLNHEWLWSAKWRGKKDSDRSADKLPELRRLIQTGQYEEAAKFGNDYFSPRGGISNIPARIDAFQSAGCFYISTDVGCSCCSRELDMRNGMVRSSHGSPQILLKREYIADLVSDRIYVRLKQENSIPFSGSCRLDRSHTPNDEQQLTIDHSLISLRAQIPGKIHFLTQAKIFAVNGGILNAEAYRLNFENVTEIIAVIDIKVQIGENPKTIHNNLSDVKCPDWEELRRRHTAEWQKLYSGCRIEIPNGGDALRYFNYGRYLFLSATAKAELPPNLQGKWNEELNPPWRSDYHLNINLQMNFWGADQTGLGFLNKTLFDYLDRLADSGRKVAQETWGVQGIFIAHASDVWAQATPEAYGWSVWLGVAPWFAQHYMKYYRYTLDHKFLRERAWPFLRDTAIFFEQLLQTDENGVLEIIPSQSPENQFKGGGWPVSLCASSACDIELLEELLRDTLWVAKELNLEPEHQQKWQEMRDQLPKIQVGNDGRLMEWGYGFEDAEPGHRHISHLIGLYPGSTITRTATPALFAAARKSLDFRLANYGGHTGWSRAWTANFFTAFADGDHALETLEHLVEKQSSTSLLDLHPPRVFQIDGNLGAVSVIPSMLLQTIEGVLYILPALPTKWTDGDAWGIHAEKALMVDLSWRHGKLRKVCVKATKMTTFQLKVEQNYIINQAYRINNGIAEISLQPEEQLEILCDNKIS